MRCSLHSWSHTAPYPSVVNRHCVEESTNDLVIYDDTSPRVSQQRKGSSQGYENLDSCSVYCRPHCFSFNFCPLSQIPRVHSSALLLSRILLLVGSRWRRPRRRPWSQFVKKNSLLLLQNRISTPGTLKVQRMRRETPWLSTMLLFQSAFILPRIPRPPHCSDRVLTI